MDPERKRQGRGASSPTTGAETANRGTAAAARLAGTAIVQVAVAAPLPMLFDYLPPADPAAPPLQPGIRVLVPFGRGRRVGLIVAQSTASSVPDERLKPVIAVLDRKPLLPSMDLDFLLWSATYYQYPPGDALFSALPARLRRPEPVDDATTQAGWRATALGLACRPHELARAPKQARILSLLRDAPAGLPATEIQRRLGACSAPLRAMAGRGWVEACRLDATAAATPVPPVDPPALSSEQHTAVEAVQAALGTFRAFLLDGVTASGKTEVYIRLIAATLAVGRRALVLVPEIGLTPQLERRLAERLPGSLVVLHSGLAEGERWRAWQRVRDGYAAVLVGTRSAVFAPLPDLGLILVDEEHDLSLKQQDGFRYSARDLAVRRAQLLGCPVVLGSATPSLETLANARVGRYQWLRLRERAGGARPPSLQLIDIRAQPLQAGAAPALVQAAEMEVTAGNQVLLFLNRRGYAPVLTCHDCGWIGDCPHCDARLTLHRSQGQLRCHHCGWVRLPPEHCPACGGPDLRTLGQGTERLEDMLAQRFPGVPLARIDRDSTRRKGALSAMLMAARRGDYPILLGTQMLTKGHHFPGVTLVGVLDADLGLFGTDFRAPERLAQLLVQVTGRAGRATRPGRVLVQTRHPEHPLLVSLLREGYPAFAAAALEERQLAGLPPFSYQALMRAEAPDEEAPLIFLRQAAQAIPAPAEVALWGPAPAPMARRAGRWRAQLLAQSSGRAALHRFLAAWLPQVRRIKCQGRVRWSVDVDPQEMG